MKQNLGLKVKDVLFHLIKLEFFSSLSSFYRLIITSLHFIINVSLSYYFKQFNFKRTDLVKEEYY